MAVDSVRQGFFMQWYCIWSLLKTMSSNDFQIDLIHLIKIIYSSCFRNTINREDEEFPVSASHRARVDYVPFLFWNERFGAVTSSCLYEVAVTKKVILIY